MLPRHARRDPRLAVCYLRLECPLGADLQTVCLRYRRLVARHHPDLHSHDPRRQAIANRITARLTEAYRTLEQALG